MASQQQEQRVVKSDRAPAVSSLEVSDPPETILAVATPADSAMEAEVDKPPDCNYNSLYCLLEREMLMQLDFDRQLQEDGMVQLTHTAFVAAENPDHMSQLADIREAATQEMVVMRSERMLEMPLYLH